MREGTESAKAARHTDDPEVRYGGQIMRLIEGLVVDRELTYSDVFLVPSFSDI